MVSEISVAFIGSAGLPNKYGGFEAFLEHCAPVLAKKVKRVLVTCDSRLYPDKGLEYEGVERVFIDIPANGSLSVIHDLVAFFSVIFRSTHVVVLGVSGGPWFPVFRLVSSLMGKKLIVNVDGVEWKRGKFSGWKKRLLKAFDSLAQRFSNSVIYDNAALKEYLISSAVNKSHMIPYPGDYVSVLNLERDKSALTICRIEPENNVEMLIEGVLGSKLDQYIFVGNWSASEFGRSLRKKYEGEGRLHLLDPIYDRLVLAEMRSRCGSYIHGHSVGGTNPSLVEMLFYDCHIYCFDVNFHHETAGDNVEYFSSATGLSAALNESRLVRKDRKLLRQRYTREVIVDQYLSVLK